MSEDPARYGDGANTAPPSIADAREALDAAASQIQDVLSDLEDRFGLSGFTVLISTQDLMGGPRVSDVEVRAQITAPRPPPFRLGPPSPPIDL